MKTKSKAADLVPAKILRSDRARLRKWAAQRDMKIYQIINIKLDI